MNMRARGLAALALLALLRAAPARAHAAPEEEDAQDQDAQDELALHQEESRNVRPRAFPPAAYNALPSGFRAAPIPAPSPAQPSLAELAGYRAPPHLEPASAPLYEPQAPARAHQRKFQEQRDRPAPARLQQQQQQQRQQQLELEEEEEREEPDRLSQLLQQSRFECAGKQTGYYADQELACEVFHYCQDSVKHSWICPDGFTFHQVHLICMPPTHDNICQKSAKYHFVNEYLYRPINEEEVQRKPNVSLKYSDRYYPAEVYRDDRYEDDEEEEETPRRASPAAATAAPRPHPAPAPQVFRSAEEVNIPLVQRRPQRPYEFDF